MKTMKKLRGVRKVSFRVSREPFGRIGVQQHMYIYTRRPPLTDIFRHRPLQHMQAQLPRAYQYVIGSLWYKNVGAYITKVCAFCD